MDVEMVLKWLLVSVSFRKRGLLRNLPGPLRAASGGCFPAKRRILGDAFPSAAHCGGGGDVVGRRICVGMSGAECVAPTGYSSVVVAVGAWLTTDWAPLLALDCLLYIWLVPMIWLLAALRTK